MIYNKSDLQKLHVVLYEVLGELDRVCKVLKIPYFIQGGTAIGAFYYEGILPWDDDIDIGMLRSDYRRFLKEAPSVIGESFYLQHFLTEKDTPYYWAKLMKNGTLFIEENVCNLNIHHGIFIDIFPYDNVPDNHICEKLQRRFVIYFSEMFIHKQRHTFPIRTPVLWIFAFLSSRQLFGLQEFVSTLWNGKKTKYVSIVKMPKDQISAEDVYHLVKTLFGPLIGAYA